MFCYFGIGPAFPFLPVMQADIAEAEIGDNVGQNQLMALVETEDEAQEIAKQYGIEFVSFSEGVATYKTEEDPSEVIARGEENGYPPIFMNYVRSIH